MHGERCLWQKPLRAPGAKLSARFVACHQISNAPMLYAIFVVTLPKLKPLTLRTLPRSQIRYWERHGALNGCE